MKRIPFVAALLFLACSFVSTEAPADKRPQPSPEDVAPTLDAGEAAALAQSIVAEIEQVRGLKFKRTVPVEVIDDDEARRYMLARLERFGMREQMQTTARAYRLLRLLPDDVDPVEAVLDAMREQAGGFYDPQRETFYLLSDMPSSLLPMLTAHELTHALEDQYYDLDGRLEEVLDDDDRLFALSAVHEGSAMLVMTRFTAGQLARGETTPARLAEQARAQEAQQRALDALPPVLLRQLLGPYVLGASFLTRGDVMKLAAGGAPADLERVYVDGPTSSEQILHPEKYWDAAEPDVPRTVRLDGVGAVLGPRWERVAEGVLGELLLATLVGAETPSDAQMMVRGAEAWTNEAAAGWGGDRWQLWQRGRAAVAVLAIEWDTEGDRAEFVEALPDMPGVAIAESRTRVALIAGKVGRKKRALLEAALAAPPVVPPNRNR